MNKLGLLKRLCVLACVLALPLWWANYALTVFGDMYVHFGLGALGVYFGVFGAPLILLFCILGGIIKRRRLSAVLCSIGLLLFVLDASAVCLTAYNVGNSHTEPYKGLQAADMSGIEIWLGEDEQGADIWQELSAEEAAEVLGVLQRVDYYKEWHGEYNISEFSQISTERPEWHFRLNYADGRSERLFVGGPPSHYLISYDGAAAVLYQSRPYDMWDGDCWNQNVRSVYQDLMLKYEL